MSERNKAGIADQDVQPEREYRVEQNLAGDIDVIGFADDERNGEQRKDRGGDGKVAANHSV